MFEVWRYKRFHISYLLAWLALGLLIGLQVGRYVSIQNDTWLVFIALILLLGSVRSSRWWSIPIVIFAGVILGLLRGSAVADDYETYQSLVGQTVVVQGVMSGDAQSTTGGRQKLTLRDVQISNKYYPGEVFVTVFSTANLKRGDTLRVQGKIREGFASYGGAVSGGEVLSIRRGTDVVRDIRERFAGALRHVVIEPMASLGLGFVVGQRSTLPDTLDEQLKIVGLTHIVVASGYNLTILVRFMMRSLSRHSRYLTLVGSLLIIFGFVLFSGFSPSMNRAVIVTVLSLLAWYVGRRFQPIILIIYVAAMTALFNPMYVWADLGWYLSFFAFAGILVVAPLLMKLIYRRRSPSSFEQLVMETISAELMALPLIAFAFSTVPVFALVANVLVGPFIPAAMALTAITGTLGMLSDQIAAVVALPTTILIGYMIAVVEWLASLPFAQYEADLGLWPALIWYTVMGIVCVLAWRRTGYDFRARDHGLEP